MENSKVIRLGGNQYAVTIDDNTENVDLDGNTIVSDDDYTTLENAGMNMDVFLSPQHSEGDAYWYLAAKDKVNYSGFDADSYISNHS